MIRAVRHMVATVTAVRFALSARRDLLLELLALHHPNGNVIFGFWTCRKSKPFRTRRSRIHVLTG